MQETNPNSSGASASTREAPPLSSTSDTETASRAAAENPGAEMPTAFEPHSIEERWHEAWQSADVASPQPPRAGASTRPFVLTIPPPNVTGVLHLGHALQHSIHDCLLRFHRMKGETALCIPGTDHASIATEVKVKDLIEATLGKSRHDLTRDEFLGHAWDWKEKYGGAIIGQLKALGCSYDWSRERFTMDAEYSRAVLTVFKKWYDEGLIYRGFRLVNWSPGARSTVSDLEIEYREVAGKLWHIRYPVEGEDASIVVATTRPETMLGDTAVAVHPDDERYQNLVGKRVKLPLTNRTIPIIADEYVDASFGSGAVKITPAHDPNDYEMGQRHGLEQISVIGFDAKMTDAAGEYSQMTREEARRKIVADLASQGLLEKTEEYTHSVGHCSRTGSVIEPLLSEQWFVSMARLAAPVADAIKMNRVRYVPPRFANTSLDWMENVRDWCISRQLWWGHRIPVYYGPNGEVKVSVEPITEDGWHQDEDVLDTWFSSALWPFAVLGWPDDFQKEFYPTSVLITGRDILNLWVSRMILTSLHFVDGEIPFYDVLVHPTIQDCFGLRMSKSLGTGIDPMELIQTYGTDATRFGLLQLATPTQDVKFLDQAEAKLGEETVRRCVREKKPLPLQWDGKPAERFPQMQQARNFANKIWNAARFVLTAEAASTRNEFSAVPGARRPAPGAQDLPSRWILSRLNSTVESVTSSLENYAFEEAAKTLYEFAWSDFCDWFIEVSKPKLRAGDATQIALLSQVLETTMRLLHPFMPFLTEEIWARLPKRDDAKVLALADWPKPIREYSRPEDEADFALLQEVVRALRNLRAEANTPPSRKVNAQLFPTSPRAARVLAENETVISQLANLENLSCNNRDAARPQNALSAALSEVEVFLPLEGLVDVERERARLEKERDSLHKDLAVVEKKLGNAQFVEKAPAAVLGKERGKQTEITASLRKIEARLAAL